MRSSRAIPSSPTRSSTRRWPSSCRRAWPSGCRSSPRTSRSRSCVLRRNRPRPFAPSAATRSRDPTPSSRARCARPPDKFQVISKEAVEAIAAQEGGIEAEESLPGVQVKWSAEARDALREVTDAYLRRRAKARVEKYARSRKIAVITCELALPMIEETVGRDKLGAGWDTLLATTKFTPAAEVRAGEATA